MYGISNELIILDMPTPLNQFVKETEVREKLKRALLSRHPSMKEYVADRCVEKYLSGLLPEILWSWTSMRKEDKELAMGMNDIKRDIGRISANGHVEYICDIMHEHTSTSLIEITFTGNVGKNSRAVINPLYKGDIMEELRNLTIELNPKRLRELDEKANHSVTVNPNSLESYITQTRRQLQFSGDPKWVETLERNLAIATTLKPLIRQADDGPVLDEYWEEIDCGRIYGHGLSLQRIPKEIRHALLGECHKYDFKACSFATMAGLAKLIDPDIKIAALTDYITHRKSIRNLIATEVGISEEWTKGIFTSLGFGAEMRDTPFMSIRGKIGQEKFDILNENGVFKTIHQALETVSETILKCPDFKGTFELNGRSYNPIDPKTNIRRTNKQKLAWIYQNMESDALRIFIRHVGQEPLLMTHDCLYFRQSLSYDKFSDAHFYIQQQYPLLSFEHEHIIPIQTDEDFAIRKSIPAIEIDHKRLIAQQEFIAASWTPINAQISDKPFKRQIETPWGMIDEDALPKEYYE
jgi:hypothetical protein